MTDRVLTFTLCVCLAWLAIAAATHMTEASEGLKVLRARLRQAAVLSLLAFTALFSSWYYLRVPFLKPSHCIYDVSKRQDAEPQRLEAGKPQKAPQPPGSDAGTSTPVEGRSKPGTETHQQPAEQHQAQLTRGVRD